MANRIALRLFTGGTGQRATRLLLEYPGGNLGGWGLGPARDAIWQELRREFEPCCPQHLDVEREAREATDEIADLPQMTWIPRGHAHDWKPDVEAILVRALSRSRQEEREWWETVLGRVTIHTPDFFDWIAARLDRIEDRDQGSAHGGVDYCIRLRRIATAIRALGKEKD